MYKQWTLLSCETLTEQKLNNETFCNFVQLYYSCYVISSSITTQKKLEKTTNERIN